MWELINTMWRLFIAAFAVSIAFFLGAMFLLGLYVHMMWTSIFPGKNAEGKARDQHNYLDHFDS